MSGLRRRRPLIPWKIFEDRSAAEGGNSGSEGAGTRLQNLYWKQLIQLKVECEYIRRYQGVYRWWVVRIRVTRAGASATALGAWAATHLYPFVWGGIIALAQTADAIQGVLPVYRQYGSTSALVIALDASFINALAEWEDIFAGRVDQAALVKAKQRLMKQMHDVKAKHFPNGIHRRDDLFRLAERDAAAYFEETFGAGSV